MKVTVHDIAGLPGISATLLEADRPVHKVFCCDLLSVAMARAPEDSVWVTVMGNVNVVAVASLADIACVVIAEGYSFDEAAIKAAEGKLTLLRSPMPIFETADMIAKSQR